MNHVPVRGRTLYIVSTVKSGGTLKYFNDLAQIAGNGNFVMVDTLSSLNRCIHHIKPDDIVAIQQVFRPCSITPNALNRFLQKLPPACRVFATVHDNYYMSGKWVCEEVSLYDPVEPTHPPQPFPHPRVNDIVCPSRSIFNYFCKFFHHPSVHVIPHPDKVQLPPLNVPPIRGMIRLGIITSIQRYKGSEQHDDLFNNPPPGVEFYVYADYDARQNVVVRGAYNEDDIYDKLKADGVHGLIFFNKWPESYCYALSKGINTGLPIYYTPIGAVEERLTAYEDDRFHAVPEMVSFMSYIREKQGTNYPPTHDPRTVPLNVPDFYVNLFKKMRRIPTSVKNRSNATGILAQATLPARNKQKMNWNGGGGLGFVMVRCVRDRTSGMYWLEAVKRIRQFYPNVPIVIIDDNSNPRFTQDELRPDNCLIVASEYPGRGEMLGYYYFWKNHWFERAVIVHDSVFIHQKVDFACPNGVKFLWHFETKDYDDVPVITSYLDKIDPCYKGLFEDKEAWKGCFGVMAVIRHDFLEKLSGMFVLLDEVKERVQRMCVERVFAVMCIYHAPALMHDLSFMGDILDNPLGWGYVFACYQREKTRIAMPSLVKVWSGR